MARFVIEYTAGIEKRRQTSFLARRPGVTREGQSLAIGTRSSSGLVLDDPLVADQHCTLTWQGDGFVVTDLGTTLGTYLNGSAVAGPTPLGAQGEIVLGVSRLGYTCDLETRVLALTVDDQGFHYKTFKPDLDRQDPGDEYDSVRWTKSETRFGRLPGLLALNLVAALVIALAIPLVFVRGAREPWFDPGPLAGKHLAVMGPGGSGKDGCATCHDGFGGGTPAGKCGQAGCHQALLANFHPSEQPFREGRTSCTACHQDHQGSGRPELADPLPGLVPDKSRTARTCGTCHPTGVPDRVRRPAPPQTYALVAGRFGFSTFAHEDHVAQKQIPCGDCHQLKVQGVAADLASGFPARAFTAVQFGTCMGCHGRDSTHPRAPAAEHRFAVAWHGSEDPGKCLQCHQTRFAAALRQAPVAEGIPSYGFRTRSHAEQHAQRAATPTCESCHLDQVFGGEGQRQAVTFPHQSHLPRLIPRSDAERKTLNALCVACHREQSVATALASPIYPGPSDPAGKADPCAECHQGGATVLPQFVPPPAQPQRTRADFPHGRHVNSTDPTLAHGCYACHEFRSDADALTARPRTFERAADCTLCHARHDHVGGNDCARCHQRGDRVWFGAAGAYRRSWPVDFDLAGQGAARALVTDPPGPVLPGVTTGVPLLPAAPARFSHRSQGHAGERCELCHASAAAARTVEQVPIPGEADPVCRDCHVRQQARFHWR